MADDDALEKAACIPEPVGTSSFNNSAVLPYGCEIDHIHRAMQDFIDFLGFVNTQLNTGSIERLEVMLMPANFSSLVGEFAISAISKYCPTLAKNEFHNGHPDLVPRGMYVGNAVQYAHEGIEVKASRYMRGWQGHNPEESWLLVFVFSANRGRDAAAGRKPRPLRFEGVYGAQLEPSDWTYAGRSETSRRTITASVNAQGYAKMAANWIYRRQH